MLNMSGSQEHKTILINTNQKLTANILKISNKSSKVNQDLCLIDVLL